MNNKAPYEILIAEKTAQLPIPDMADFIWSRIETGLDAAAQESIDDTPKQRTRSKTVRSNAVRNGIIITAAVIIAVTIWFIKKRKKNPENNKALPAINEPVKASNITDSNTVTLPPLKNALPPEKKDDNILDAPAIKKPDSINYINTDLRQQNPVIKNDSLVTPSGRFGVLDNSSKIVLPPVIKPRGVKGISDSDYKIIMMKKDSAGKKN